MTRVNCVAASAVGLVVCLASQVSFAGDLVGELQLSGQPAPVATVTLWRTAGNAPPVSLVETSTDESGAFKMLGFPEGKPGGVYYLTTRSGPGDAVGALP